MRNVNELSQSELRKLVTPKQGLFVSFKYGNREYNAVRRSLDGKIVSIKDITHLV